MLDPAGVACMAMIGSDQMAQSGDGGAAVTINYSGGGNIGNYSSSQMSYGGRVSGGQSYGQSHGGGGNSGHGGMSYGRVNHSHGGQYGGINQSHGGGSSHGD